MPQPLAEAAKPRASFVHERSTAIGGGGKTSPDYSRDAVARSQQPCDLASAPGAGNEGVLKHVEEAEDESRDIAAVAAAAGRLVNNPG